MNKTTVQLAGMIVSGALCSGCLATSALLEKAEARKIETERFLELESAFETERGLVLGFSATGGPDAAPRQVQIVIPAADLARQPWEWAGLDGSIGRETRAHFVREERLAAGRPDPAVGRPVPIERLETTSVDALAGPFPVDAGHTYKVYEIRGHGLEHWQAARQSERWRPTAGSSAWVVAVVASRQAEEAEVSPALLQGTYRLGKARKGLLVLAPLTVAADAVTFPFQFIYTMVVIEKQT